MNNLYLQRCMHFDYLESFALFLNNLNGSMKFLPSAKYSLEDCPGTLSPTLDHTPLQKPLMKIPPGKIALQQLKKQTIFKV